MKTLILKKDLTKIIILISIATIAPLFQHQLITGTLVNATLFIATVLIGVQAGIIVSFLPSLIALSVGFLPPVFLPMIPYIILGNIVLVITFNYFKKKYWLGVVLASIFKFLFLFSVSSLVINFLIKQEVAYRIIFMMSWPQLITALLGGLIAFYVIKKNKI